VTIRSKVDCDAFRSGAKVLAPPGFAIRLKVRDHMPCGSNRGGLLRMSFKSQTFRALIASLSDLAEERQAATDKRGGLETIS